MDAPGSATGPAALGVWRGLAMAGEAGKRSMAEQSVDSTARRPWHGLDRNEEADSAGAGARRDGVLAVGHGALPHGFATIVRVFGYRSDGY